MGNLRMVLCCTSSSKIISPVRSRCLLLRIPAPSDSEMSAVLQKVADGEGFDLPLGFKNRLIQESKGNLRKALLMLEASRVEKYIDSLY